MRIEQLGVTDFRNYQAAELAFEPGITLLHGNNGVGKTNILEALYLASVGKSPRTHRDSLMIRRGAQSASVRVRFVRRETEQRVQVILHARQKKELYINETPVRQKEIVGTLQTVFFGPDDLQLIKGSPGMRRRFLDLTLSRANPVYYDALLRYNRILQQRNILLKEKYHHSLVGWDEQLAEQAVYLTEQRYAAVAAWNIHAKAVARELTAGDMDLHLAYKRRYTRDEEVSKEHYLALLAASEEQDRHYGYTSVGPHRGDLAVYNGDLDLADYGSQGEQRAAVLSLKLSEIRYLRERTGEVPVLLLDDVLSELDPARQKALLAWTAKNEVQMLITAAYLPAHLRPEGIKTVALPGGGENE